MKNQSMFPYRRNGPKKRGKGGGGGGRRHREGGGGGNGGGGGALRRIPGSAGELLPLMQPATKALAQMLAGNTKQSGQLVHARNILGQANRLVDERHVDRLPPAAREEFFEQLARLKLTITDAEEAGLVAEPEFEAKPIEHPGVDRLREVALRLATAEAPPLPVFAGPAMVEDDEEEGPAPPPVRPAAPVGINATREPLRLGARPAETGPDGGPAGPRRERLRLKATRPTGPDQDA